jgi:hypothetical protein
MYEDRDERLCRFVGMKSEQRSSERDAQKWEPDRISALVLSIPTLLLDVSIFLFLIGLGIMLFSAAVLHWGDLTSRDNKVGHSSSLPLLSVTCTDLRNPDSHCIWHLFACRTGGVFVSCLLCVPNAMTSSSRCVPCGAR